MRPFDRDAELARQLGCAAGMVEMAVRQKDLFQRHPFQGHRLFDPVEVPAGVDDGTLLGARTPHQGTILLVGGDRKDRGLDRGHIHAISDSSIGCIRPTFAGS